MELDEKQNLQKKIILKCLAHEITTMQAAMVLSVTRRCIQKRIVAYKQKGDWSFIHGNTGKHHKNAAQEEIRKKIEDIFLNTRIDGLSFSGISYSYFQYCLAEYYHIKASVTYVKKILNCIGYKTPNRCRKKKGTLDHLYRPRKEHEGELVQADGSSFDWFRNGKQYCIQGFVDDATGEPVGLYMTRHECLLGYIEAFRMMALDEGLPQAVYPDRAGVFFINPKTGTKTAATEEHEKIGEKKFTQFGRIMDEMGVDMFPAYTPEAKGRIERFWGTIQQQLPFWFMIHKVNTIEKANIALKIFMKEYSHRYGVEPKDQKTFFVTADKHQINSLLKVVIPAKTDKGGVFSLKGYRFFCPTLPYKKIHVCMSEKDGLWVTPENSSIRHKVKLVETDTSGKMPEVWKDLIETFFLRNTKAKYREVYLEPDIA